MATFKQAQQLVGLAEGGYQSDPRDEGNYYMGHLIGTKWGISAPVLGAYLGRIPSKQEMIDLTRSTAENILRVNFWNKTNLEHLKNQSVANLIYDGVVNHGTNGMRFLVEKSLKILKRPLSYYEVFTMKGIQVLNGLNQRKLFDTIKQARADKYRSSKQTYYIKGWLARLDRIQYFPNKTFPGIWPAAAMLVVGIGLLLIAL